MINRPELKARGLAAFKNNYGWCLLAALIMGLVSGGSSGGSSYSNYNKNSSDYSNMFNHGDNGVSSEQMTAILGIVLVIVLIAMLLGIAFSVFVTSPVMVGCKRFFAVNAFEKANISEVGFSFKKGRYMNIVKVMFMKNLFIALWTLLLIIPGIIKSYEYHLVEYILSEDPTLDYKEALEQSKQMMDGHKMDTFILQLSFIGWALLGILTCGILLILYVNPWMCATDAELFLDLRTRHFGPGIQPYHQVAFAGGFGGGFGAQPNNFGGQPNGYYNPNEQNGFGAPQGGYSAPQGDPYGQPYNPGQASSYGQPYTPGQPSAPQDPYGQPAAPQDPYGQPIAPQDPYGQPVAPQDPYGQPSVPQDPYGQAPQATDPNAYYGQEPNSNNDKPFGLD